MGSGTLAFASWHRAYELEQKTKGLLASLEQRDRDCETLRRTIAWERDDKEKIKRALKWTKEELERNAWTSKVMNLGLIGVGFTVGLMR